MGDDEVVLIKYRPFLNTDPPKLADVWRSQAPLRGLAQAVSINVLEKHVFSKPYFEREGLLVAEELGRVIGFSHAGFGPVANFDALGRDEGVVSRVMLVNHPHKLEVADELLRLAEAYLIDRSVKRIHAGGHKIYCPFYLGLYGGSRLPGILSEDEFLLNLFLSHGYSDVGKHLVFQARLPAFRPIVNQQQMQVRRQYQVMAVVDPIPENWWDSCTLGMTERTKFLLVERRSGLPHGSVSFWDIEPLSSAWGVHAMGMFDLYIEEPYRRRGLATFLVGESLRQLQTQGITLAEIQIPEEDTEPKQLFEKLGFNQVDYGRMLSKAVGDELYESPTLEMFPNEELGEGDDDSFVLGESRRGYDIAEDTTEYTGD